MQDKFITKEKFSKEVEEFIVSHSTGIMEAILHKMSEKNLEFEAVKKYLTPNLLEKLELEAQEANMVKRDDKSTLPI